MLPSEDDCDDCIPEYMRHTNAFSTFVSALPFILTFLIVASVVSIRLFPLLSGSASSGSSRSQRNESKDVWRPSSSRERWIHLNAKSLASLTFSANIALSTVLVELILCEISDSLNRAARTAALKVTLPSLLFLLILVAPALEIHSVISSAGFGLGESGKRRFKTAWVLECLGLFAWLSAFWYLGQGLLGSYLHEEFYTRDHSLSEGCLERIGIIGISLMASLAGFAAISSLWQTFGAKTAMVTESDITRRQTGLDATQEMLEAKRSRLRALQRKMSDIPSEGFMTRMISTVRGNPEAQERNSLQMEISGLEAMLFSLSNSVTSLEARRQTQIRSRTAFGRLLNLFSYGFSLYCLYRICATAFATLRRFYSPATSFSNSDPINNMLALLAKHWDPSLDRAAWSRQISFFLSGVMLLASFNSVLQTFLLFARIAPGVVRQAQANLALIVSQVSATYVISSALLLRSNLPKEVSSVISEVLGAPLEPVFVERWFEGWFLAVTTLTAAGIWVGKQVKSGGWDDDDMLEGDVEMGKMS
ncbi:hypothetical protein M501DRAFT_1012724 [Patellaria atrata CBS 101060]|uniref:Abscisic acid G-protein coupled receptor-like domain-containing protein n=1 Tax=Patellaria atrata CBS 101060 TaxID=1346257 RepID=A0A9P4SIM4_9PEZI|nr:hypothetical protein M501DRAFT_1012724 [Patellaria atrata CBS 101060]